jgi:hypothetical protein
MSALTNYLESTILNHLFRGIAYSAPSTLYIGLNQSFNSGSLKSGIVDEPTGGGYSRQSYTSNSSNWITPFYSGIASGVTYNNNQIQFPVATSDIGNVSGIFIADDAASGNILFFGQLNSPRFIRSGDQFVFSSGSLKVSAS